VREIPDPQQARTEDPALEPSAHGPLSWQASMNHNSSLPEMARIIVPVRRCVATRANPRRSACFSLVSVGSGGYGLTTETWRF